MEGCERIEMHSDRDRKGKKKEMKEKEKRMMEWKRKGEMKGKDGNGWKVREMR